MSIKQAIEALEAALSDDQPYIDKARAAIAALRSMPQGEPVAWAATSEDGEVEALGMNQSRRFDTPLCFCTTPHTEAWRMSEVEIDAIFNAVAQREP